MSTPSPQAEYKQEVRFAVVMYGGVSLAIYINGVAQELLKLVRSTAANQIGKPLSGTEAIYREVSWLLAEESVTSLSDVTSTSAPPTRFVVDVLSGTSAGGINGIFLAKALANGQDLDQLKELWIKEGDIETLLNDKRSIEKPLKLQNPPSSLLNSERMYFELLKAFQVMDQNTADLGEQAESPYVDELDLFVTSTDLQGVVLPIALSDGLVYERRHRNVMRFAYSQPSVSGEPTRNDFYRKFNPFLAYAARCTSSFPFAFEPMALSDIDTLLAKLVGYQSNDDWKSTSADYYRFYHDYRQPTGIPSIKFPERAFGDGGYLDNKPFTYATEMVMNRTASVPVDRKLIFIEPSPEHPEDDVEQIGKPDAIANVMSALLTLPRYETIREDLKRISDRNRLIDRVNAVTSGVDRDENVVREASTELFGDAATMWNQLGALITPPSSDKLWASYELSDEQHGQLDLTDCIKRKGRAYAAYLRLRISAVTDEVAQLITRVAGFDETSEYSIIVRSMVRAWRIQKYIEYRKTAEDTRDTVNKFLFEFDLSYPIRRVNYLRNKVDGLTRFESDLTTVIESEAKKFDLNLKKIQDDEKLKDGFCHQVQDHKADLNNLYIELRRSARSLRARHSAEKAKEAGTSVKVSPLHEQVGELMQQISRVVAKETDKQAEGKMSVLDYFLGKRETGIDKKLERSYKAATPEDLCVARAETFLEAHGEIRDLIDSIARELSSRVTTIKKESEQKISDLFTATSTKQLDEDPQLDTVKWIAKYCVGHFYREYEDYDLLTYPILYDTDVGEADVIDVIRVSPEDAKQLIDERSTGSRKLAGTALGHFGAFLQGSWRENDILWGRLDGAERIITALLPNHPLRQKLIGRAHATIICEALKTLGQDQTNKLLAESCMRTAKGKPDPNLLNQFIENLFQYSADDNDLSQQLQTLINRRSLSDYYEANFPDQSQLNREATMRSMARATTVIGKILESLSSDRRVSTKYVLWIARLGQIFWAMVEVAVPRSFANIIFRHFLKLVYFLEALLIVGATLLAQPQMQQFGITAFGITAGIHLSVMILSDLLSSNYRLLNLVKAVVIALVALLVSLGVFTLTGVLGVKSTWHLLSSWQQAFAQTPSFGLNLPTALNLGLLLLLVLFFFLAARPHLFGIFKKSKTYSPSTNEESS